MEKKKRVIKCGHTLEGFNGNLTRFMKRYYEDVSASVGGNKNNQATINHGIQIVALRASQRKGIDTKKLYPNIRH